MRLVGRESASDLGVRDVLGTSDLGEHEWCEKLSMSKVTFLNSGSELSLKLWSLT